jgi:hypothetical protein
MATSGLTQEELKDWLNYNQDTGVFTRKKYASLKRPCGTIDNDGYLRISVKSKVYKAHHLAWLWVYGNLPNGIIDHINQVANDNKILNLREATYSVNALNSNKKSGVYKHGSKFRARVKIGDKHIHLGVFDSESQARDVYLSVKENHIRSVYGG